MDGARSLEGLVLSASAPRRRFVVRDLTLEVRSPGRDRLSVETPDGTRHEFRVTRRGRDQVEVEAAGGATRVFTTATDGEQTWVHGPGGTHTVSHTPTATAPSVTPAASPAARPSTPSSDPLGAPMPATVSEVLVTPGASVTAGQTLVVLEAMKMELRVSAPEPGIVAAVRCRPGDLVSPGPPLVEITPTGSAREPV